MTNDTDRDAIVDMLQAYLEALKSHRWSVERWYKETDLGLTPHNSENTLRNESETLLIESGKLKSLVHTIVGRYNLVLYGASFDPWREAFAQLGGPRTLSSLTAVVNDVQEAIGYLQGQEVRAAALSIIGSSAPPRRKVFISHDGESQYRTRLEIECWRMGAEPVTAEEQTSPNESVDARVDRLLEDSSFAIVLATLEGAGQRKGAYTISGSVVDEISRIRTKLGDSFIVLLEEGIEPPTTQGTGIIYEQFSKETFDSALLKVLKSLIKYGII